MASGNRVGFMAMVQWCTTCQQSMSVILWMEKGTDKVRTIMGMGGLGRVNGTEMCSSVGENTMMEKGMWWKETGETGKRLRKLHPL